MRATFDACCGALDGLVGSGEHYLAWFEAEATDFVRFNRGAVRQAGSVRQAACAVRLIVGRRHGAARVTLAGDETADRHALRAAVERLRQELTGMPEDPYLLYSTVVQCNDSVRRGHLPSLRETVADIAAAASGLDFVGISAAGPICRGFASSFGSRRWHETQSFNVDYSLHLSGDKAVKSRYAGFEWHKQALLDTVATARSQLTMLEGPAMTLPAGRYRAYLAPAAMAEIIGLMAWGGFGIKAQRTRQSPLQRLLDGNARLSELFTLGENTGEGLAADFDMQGFSKPAGVSLIAGGAMAGALISPRSAQEFDVATNGANAEETPESLDLAGGDLSSADVLRRLGTGLYVNNLWYSNYSDRPAGKMTGMTRFATLWVENGEIVAPVNVMRFDENIYRMLGSNLEALTRDREFLPDASSYGARSTQSWRLPGALIRDFTLTL